jgi:putative flavoprotein involved in K+ transport
MTTATCDAPVLDALVIGAGPAGLATSRALRHAGIRHLVLERGDRPGQTWSDLYDSLVLHTARPLSALPGMAFANGAGLFPTRRDFVTYLAEYAKAFTVPLRTNTEVRELRRGSNMWRARVASGGEVTARSVVVATGIAANPHVPQLKGQRLFPGRVMHSVDYRRPDGFIGQRVLVLGSGNSGVDIALDLAAAGVDVVLAGRTRSAMVPLTLAGIPTHYFGFALAPFLARTRCPRPPIVGRRLDAAIRAGAIRRRSALIELTDTAARFDDGEEPSIDTIILATGFRPAVGFLDGLITLDDCGFPERKGRVASTDQPDLYFVGHRYDARGALYNIGRDAATAAALVRSSLSETHRTPIGMRQPHYGK